MPLKFGFVAQTIVDEGKVTWEEINEIKKWLETQSNLPNYTDEQIINFYLACDKDKEATQSTMIAYNTLRNDVPQIFSKRNLEDLNLKLFLPIENFSILPRKTTDGCVIIYNKLNDTDYHSFNFAEYLKMTFMVLDAAIYNYPPNAFILIIDYTGVNVMHITRLKMKLIQKASEYLQTGLPVKLKTVHLINSNYIVQKMFVLIRPFLSEKVAKMFLYHTSAEMKNFHKFVPKDCLPVELGGDLPSIEILGENTLQKLRDIETHFDEEEIQRNPFKNNEHQDGGSTK